MPDTSEVTIFDVAQAAGVSITTVSRILNDKPDVSAEISNCPRYRDH